MTKIWFITGVGSGLGKALAQAALARGDIVGGTVRSAEAKAAFEASSPARARGFIVDVTDEAALTAAVESLQASDGWIDILVNNAGYGLVGAIEEASLAEVRAQFETNVFGPIAAIKAALPLMRRRRTGRIINITSVSGLAVWPGTGVYCASKFALEAVGASLAGEVTELGIKVTNVCPGGLRTDYSGRSLRTTGQSIEDYEGAGHFPRRAIPEHAGHEPGDPAKAALAILKVADAVDPPLNLLLGPDAVHYATQKIATLLAELGQWTTVTHSIDHDA
jgi:NAD(P)-dependent dehydrogenase (short-subunit alcohol dehydrogenase family)